MLSAVRKRAFATVRYQRPILWESLN